MAISPVKTLQGLAFCTHFNHAYLKKPKESKYMLMLNKDDECCNQLGFQLYTYDKIGCKQMLHDHMIQV